MTHPWQADIDISLDLAAACIDAQFPELGNAKLTVVGEGWDNVAFGVKRSYVFRFPRRKIAVKLLETETAVLPWLAPQLPLPIPTPIFIGGPSADYPYPFAGYCFLPGITACRADLADAQRTALAEPLALFLRAVHSADSARARELGAAGDAFDRLNVSRLAAPTRARIESLADRGIITADVATRLIEVLNATPTDIPPRTETLVHGDLYARHLLVSPHPSRLLTGIIDWGDLHLGDPALDLSIVFTFLPPKARDAFWSTYGQADERGLALARFRAVCGMSWIVHYAAETREADLLRESLWALQNVTSDRLGP
jgi:aminoglycoside phosphotransferase (APT) family kinase protein